MNTVSYDPLEYWNAREHPNAEVEPGIDPAEAMYISPFLSEASSVLDIGPGIGRLFPLYKKLSRVATVDLSLQYKDRVKKAAESLGITVESYYINSALAPLPFENAEFDVGIVAFVFMHVPFENIIHSLVEAARCCSNVVVMSAIDRHWPKPGMKFDQKFHCFNHDYESLCRHIGLRYHKYSKISERRFGFVFCRPNANMLASSIEEKIRVNDHPYSALPDNALWRKAVADVAGESHLQLYQRKWPITRDTKIATAGSCFAQHIGRSLRAGGFNVLDNEPAPSALPSTLHSTFGYSVYSARYGNIYTARQMLQLAKEAFGERPESMHVWVGGGRYYDALRPSVEPDGLSSIEVVRAHRRHHLEMVRLLLLNVDLMIFTLGLTETWSDRESGSVFPVCPGVVASEFDPIRHAFHNFSVKDILEDLEEFRDLLHRRQPNKRVKILLTVSPVPLTATASGRHVMQATVYSKSVLRATAGEFASRYEDVDYFPSYEIISNPWREGIYYDANLRSVSKHGVDTVMAAFMMAHGGLDDVGSESKTSEQQLIVPSDPDKPSEGDDMAVVCDEELLDAFGRSQ